ncbi:probable cytochrome P450 6a18 [Musca autumnalis]|uniref:probable cytochrome P450 6a18 n=1 Tax=Musca autumnalis TaxID=221902 RepID=UPI003CF65C86
MNKDVPMDESSVIATEPPNNNRLSLVLSITEAGVEALERLGNKLFFGIREAKVKILRPHDPNGEDDEADIDDAGKLLDNMQLEAPSTSSPNKNDFSTADFTVARVELENAKKKPLYKVLQSIYQEMYEKQEIVKAVELVFISALFVQDQKAIEQILITQYENFPDRGLYVNTNDPLLANMGRLEYDQWKPLHKKFRPCFTPNATRYMFPLMQQVCREFVHVLQRSTCGKGNIFEMRDLCSRYAVDVIGNVVFGLECNSLKDENAKFRYFGDRASEEHFRPLLQFRTKYFDLLKLFNVKYHSRETSEFFTQLVKESLEYREKYNIQRSDFMDILMKIKNDPQDAKDLEITLDRLVGVTFLFFAAGYNTTSTALCEALYEMAKNPEIQDKAREEARDTLARHENKLTFEAVKEMRYIKQIIMETLRKYTLLFATSRYSRRACTIPTSTGSLTVEPKTLIIIPNHAINNNPEFHTDPEVFRPERFDKGVKHPACTFLPFGDGPKACPAINFSYVELISCIATLLINFEFSPCDKTPKELIFNKEMLRLSIDNIFLSVKPLNK